MKFSLSNSGQILPYSLLQLLEANDMIVSQKLPNFQAKCHHCTNDKGGSLRCERCKVSYYCNKVGTHKYLKCPRVFSKLTMPRIVKLLTGNQTRIPLPPLQAINLCASCIVRSSGSPTKIGMITCSVKESAFPGRGVTLNNLLSCSGGGAVLSRQI